MEHRKKQNLKEAMESYTKKNVNVYLLTRTNGGKLFEIIIDADNPLSSLIIHMEEPYTNYQK